MRFYTWDFYPEWYGWVTRRYMVKVWFIKWYYFCWREKYMYKILSEYERESQNA
jgi:hypothetical protein